MSDWPDPTAASRQQADAVLAWAKRRGLTVADICTDVLGGMAVYLGGANREVWIACMNSGAFTAVLSESRKVAASFTMSLEGEPADRVVAFLTQSPRRPASRCSVGPQGPTGNYYACSR